MKPHFIAKFKKEVPEISAPYWADFIENKLTPVETLGKELDAIMKKYKFQFWITHEFKPKNGRANDTGTSQWSKEEVDAGLDRIYRIISQCDDDIPNQLIEEIKQN